MLSDNQHVVSTSPELFFLEFQVDTYSSVSAIENRE
jgi:hypothetical protein